MTSISTPKIPLWRLLFLCFFLFASGFFLPLFHRWIKESQVFALQTFVFKDTLHVSSKEVDAYLSSFIGKSLYDIDLNQVRQTLEQHPWVSHAFIRRVPPRQISIDLKERIPLALVILDKPYLVDEKGYLFKATETGDALLFPLIKDPTQKRILQSVEILHQYNLLDKPNGNISEIKTSPSMNTTIYFLNGCELVLGRGSFFEKLKKFQEILHFLGDKKNDLVYVYLANYPNSNQAALRFQKSASTDVLKRVF